MSDPVALALIAVVASLVTLAGQLLTGRKAADAAKAATAAAEAASIAATIASAAKTASTAAAIASQRNTEMLRYLQELVAGQKFIAAAEIADSAWKLNAEEQNQRSTKDRADLNLKLEKLVAAESASHQAVAVIKKVAVRVEEVHAVVSPVAILQTETAAARLDAAKRLEQIRGKG